MIACTMCIAHTNTKDRAGRSVRVGTGNGTHPYPQDINPEIWLPHIRGSGKLKKNLRHPSYYDLHFKTNLQSRPGKGLAVLSHWLLQVIKSELQPTNATDQYSKQINVKNNKNKKQHLQRRS